jgi:hypothetical protein
MSLFLHIISLICSSKTSLFYFLHYFLSFLFLFLISSFLDPIFFHYLFLSIILIAFFLLLFPITRTSITYPCVFITYPCLLSSFMSVLYYLLYLFTSLYLSYSQIHIRMCVTCTAVTCECIYFHHFFISGPCSITVNLHNNINTVTY